MNGFTLYQIFIVVLNFACIFQIAELTGQRDDAQVQLPTLKVSVILHTLLRTAERDVCLRVFCVQH